MRYLIIALLFSSTLYGQRNGSVMTSYYNSKSIKEVVDFTLPPTPIASDTVYLNFTSFGGNDVNAFPWNDVDVNNQTATPPELELTDVLTALGDTVGPLNRTSPASAAQSWYTANAPYSGWPTAVGGRGITTADTLTFTLGGCKADETYEFLIWAKGDFSNTNGDAQTFIAGITVHSLTGLLTQTDLISVTGNSDDLGVITISICCPVSPATKAHLLGLAIVGDFSP